MCLELANILFHISLCANNESGNKWKNSTVGMMWLSGLISCFEDVLGNRSGQVRIITSVD